MNERRERTVAGSLQVVRGRVVLFGGEALLNFAKTAALIALALAAGCGGEAVPSGGQGGSDAAPAAENVNRYDIDVTPKPVVIADRPENPYKGSYEFNEDLDWFSQNAPVWSAAMEDYKGRPDLQYLEIGCFEGRSAVWMLENVLTEPSSGLTCVDPYQDHIGEEVKQRFLSNTKKAGAADRLTMVIGFSQEKLRDLPLGKYDIIYIDGDHRAAPVLEDAVLSWRLLKTGGLMVFDDYRWEVTQPEAERPLMGVDFFMHAFKDKYELVHRDYQVIIRKTLNY